MGSLPDQAAVQRPILYTNTEFKQGVISGVQPNGRLLGPLVQDPNSMAVWSPDGSWFAYFVRDPATRDIRLCLQNLNNEVKTIFTTQDRLAQPVLAWSPDGQKIATIFYQKSAGSPRSIASVALIDVEGHRVQSRYELPPKIEVPHTPNGGMAFAKVANFRWSLDGRRILISWGKLIVIDIGTGVVQVVTDKLVEGEWGRDSDTIYYIEGSVKGVDFYLRKLDSKSLIKLTDNEQLKTRGLKMDVLGLLGPHKHISLSPGGSKLVIIGGSQLMKGGTNIVEGISRVIYIYDLRNGEKIALEKPFKIFQTREPVELIAAFDWSPDENNLAVAAATTEGLKIEKLDLGTGQWKILAIISAGEALYSYLYGFKSISWTQ
jgi:Tol biopolymer transport system component